MLYIDIETYSDVDLRNATPYRYAESPEFEILLAAWAIDDEPVKCFIGERAIAGIPGLWGDVEVKCAHNAQFERVCFSELQRKINPQFKGYLPPEMWEDTMAIAAESGLPQSLKQLALALGTEEKDEAGTRLINLFCKPSRGGERNRPEDHPDEWMDFIAYCIQDVETLRSIHKALPGWPTGHEKRVFVADQRICDRGLKVDTALARKAVDLGAANSHLALHEARAITGVDNPNSRNQLLRWFESTGRPLPDLTKETVENALSGDDLTGAQRRVLELRQDLALVASKKFQAALDGVNRDGRLRGQFRFFGAHTGRWSGRGVQPQNLPRESPHSDADTQSYLLDLDMGLSTATDLKALVRPMFTGPFSVVDYSAIEARVVAWLAGEQWVLDAVEGGRDLYVETAERMSTERHQMDRRDGKIAVLALGYNGGVGSMRAMGAEGSNDELSHIVQQWRKANPRIVNLWSRLDAAFYTGGLAGDFLEVQGKGRDRHVVLPSGRAIVYHDVKFSHSQRGRRASFLDGHRVRVDTYGGRLTENATQAVARDLLAAALVRLDDAGYRVVGHIHDEVLVETTDLEGVTACMLELPEWAAGLPVGGEGYVTQRYRKG